MVRPTLSDPGIVAKSSSSFEFLTVLGGWPKIVFSTIKDNFVERGVSFVSVEYSLTACS